VALALAGGLSPLEAATVGATDHAAAVGAQVRVPKQRQLYNARQCLAYAQREFLHTPPADQPRYAKVTATLAKKRATLSAICAARSAAAN
jgi:hypothetical protein